MAASSGVARPQAPRALAWGVEIKYFVNCSIFLLFDTVQYCSCEVGPGRNPWLATLLAASPPSGMTRQGVPPCGAGSREPNPRLAGGGTWRTVLSPALTMLDVGELLALRLASCSVWRYARWTYCSVECE
jgi:hypothetical protein